MPPLLAPAGLLARAAHDGELPEPLAGFQATLTARLDPRSRAVLSAWSRVNAA